MPHGTVASLTAVLTVLYAALPTTIEAQDVQPRVYTPAPVGVNAMTLNYAFSTGRVLFDKTIPVENVEGDVHSIAAAYSRSLGVFGLAGRADIAVPFVIGDWTGDVDQSGRTTTSRRGFGDPIARFALFFIGAPALTRVEFAQFRPKTVVGATVRVRIPLGQYDADRLINLGSNRWGFSPQLGVSHLAGRFLLEAYAATWFFTDNTALLGTSTFSQDPLFVLQVHAAYLFRKGLWLAISSRQSLGGAISVNGGEGRNREANNRIGLTLGLPLGARQALKFMATTGITSTIGNDYDSLSITWQAVF
ncbi:transporter [Gemmatimonadota bacterium]